MKVSELIEKLNEIQNKDAKILIYDMDKGHGYSIDEMIDNCSDVYYLNFASNDDSIEF